MRRHIISTFTLPFLLCMTATAWAQDAGQCASDADCPDGSACEKGMSVASCDPAANVPCDDTVTEEEFGTCVVLPVQCAADADCDEYSSCQSSDFGECWQDSEGNTGCSEPDPDAPKYCGPATFDCTTDTDCPREFECVAIEMCPAIDCAMGEDCEQPACSSTSSQCLPKQIPCEDDSVCPSDWSCMGTVDYVCEGAGGGMDGDTGGGEEIAPSEPDNSGDAAPPSDEPVPDEPVPDCVAVEVVGSCQPDAWGYAYLAADGSVDNGGGVPKGEEALDGDDSGAESSDDGTSADAAGCSVTPGGSSGPAPLTWLLLLAAPFVALRRRRSAERLG